MYKSWTCFISSVLGAPWPYTLHRQPMPSSVQSKTAHLLFKVLVCRTALYLHVFSWLWSRSCQFEVITCHHLKQSHKGNSWQPFFFLCTYTPDVNAPVFSWCLSPQLLVSLLFSEFDQSRNQQRGSFIQHEAKNSVSFVFQACPPHTATLDRRKGLPSQLFQVTALFMR